MAKFHFNNGIEDFAVEEFVSADGVYAVTGGYPEFGYVLIDEGNARLVVDRYRGGWRVRQIALGDAEVGEWGVTVLRDRQLRSICRKLFGAVLDPTAYVGQVGMANVETMKGGRGVYAHGGYMPLVNPGEILVADYAVSGVRYFRLNAEDLAYIQKEGGVIPKAAIEAVRKGEEYQRYLEEVFAGLAE